MGLLAHLLAAAVLAGCATDDTTGTEDPTPTSGELDAGATVLVHREQVASVSPSGQWMLTTSDDGRMDNDEVVYDLCVRSGATFEEVSCTAMPNSAAWNAVWSPTEDRVAFLSPGSQRQGERNDAIVMVTIPDMNLRAMSPTDAWLPAAPVAGFDPAGGLIWAWPTGENRYALHTETGPVIDDASTAGDGLPATVEGVEIRSIRIDGSGLVVSGIDPRRYLVTGRWTDAGIAEHLLPAIDSQRALLAADIPRGRVITRWLDVHVTPDPELEDRDGRTATIAGPDDAVIVAVDVEPGGDRIAALVLYPDRAEVSIRRITDDLQVVEESSTPIADRPDRRSFPTFTWTERGLVIEGRTDAEPGRVFVLPVG